MNRRLGVLLLAALLVLTATVGAEAATKRAYGKKCLAAWSGKRGTKAFRTYFPACVKAAKAATEAATAAGDADDQTANHKRGVEACAHQKAFAPPRKTKAKRAGFRACVRAAVASQKAFARGGRPLRARLSGANEVPGPGDPDATGAAKVAANIGQRRICFDLSIANVTDVTAAHIHKGAVGVAGPVVVPLTPLPAVGETAHGCVNGLDKALVKDILKHPSDYYVNVHSSDYPAGAARGQLSK
jgi:hypothetical protein